MKLGLALGYWGSKPLDRFIELARSVYQKNDLRAALKRQINTLLKSKLIEEKSYASR